MKLLLWSVLVSLLLAETCDPAATVPAADPATPGQWTALTDFGDNPGQLNAWLYTPAVLSEAPALVVVMHGCGQSAEEFAAATGWNKLADEGGFLLVYPEQIATNNINRCFNWFTPGDQERDAGEALSIRQMAQAVADSFAVDPGRIYATGFSAGGAMTAVMLSTYPDVFAGGAPTAGIPYGAADNLASGLAAMGGQIDKLPEEWALQVEHQLPDYEGAYPSVIIVQGRADNIVNPQNATEMLEQWGALHGIDVTTAPVNGTQDFAGNDRISLVEFADEEAQVPVRLFRVADLGHAYPIDAGDAPAQGGAPGQWTTDVDWHATYWIAHLW
ncbi:MAG: PHB depolymerase family esterase, partial [Lewinella sp.]|nr:PHB depolymerase family esterase [Lewinella sp.]